MSDHGVRKKNKLEKDFEIKKFFISRILKQILNDF